VSRKLQDAIRFQGNRGNSKGPNVFFHVNNLSFFAQEDQIDREHHPDGVHATGRHDPKAAPLASPSLGLSQQSDEPTQIAICHSSFGGDERLSRFVVDVYCPVWVIVFHRRLRRPPFRFLVQDSFIPYSMALLRRRQMMISSTTTANAPATIRIIVTVSIFLLLRIWNHPSNCNYQA
jgi:hypothetical protein